MFMVFKNSNFSQYTCVYITLMQKRKIELKMKAEMGALWSSINMVQINVRHLSAVMKKRKSCEMRLS